MKGFYIIGERCTGVEQLSNYLQTLLPTKEIQFSHHPTLQNLNPNLQVLMLTRDFGSWVTELAKGHNTLLHLSNKGLNGLFEEKPWWSHIPNNETEREVNDVCMPYMTFFHDIYHLRAEKHRFWLEALKKTNYIQVKYESLVNTPLTTILQLTGVTIDAIPVFLNGDENKTHYPKLDNSIENQLGYGYNDPQILRVSHQFLSSFPQIAYLWLPKIWENKLHYIKQEEIKRWQCFATILDISNLSTLKHFTYIIIDSSALPFRPHNYWNGELKPRIADFYQKISNKQIIIDFHDMHRNSFNPGSLVQFIHKYQVKTCLIKAPASGPEVRQLQSEVPLLHCIPFPFGVPSNFIPVPPTTLTKTIDIFAYGSQHPSYPLRQKIFKKLQDFQKYHKTSWKIELLETKGTSNLKQKSITGKKLFQKISNAWLTSCTSSIYRYPLLKYYETAASGSVVFGDIPLGLDSKLQAEIINIPQNATNDFIVKTLVQAKQEKQNLFKRAKSNYQIVSQNYTIMNQIIQVIGKLFPLSFEQLVKQWTSNA